MLKIRTIPDISQVLLNLKIKTPLKKMAFLSYPKL